MTFIPDQLDQRLEGMDHVVFSKRDPDPVDLRDANCDVVCPVVTDVPPHNPDDCAKLSERLSQKRHTNFTIQPSTSRFPSRFRRIIAPE